MTKIEYDGLVTSVLSPVDDVTLPCIWPSAPGRSSSVAVSICPHAARTETINRARMNKDNFRIIHNTPLFIFLLDQNHAAEQRIILPIIMKVNFHRGYYVYGIFRSKGKQKIYRESMFTLRRR